MTELPASPTADSAEIARAMPLAVSALTLCNFRSYERLDLAVEAGPIVLTGPNGAGKTNLLEAVSLLVPGRGLRRARLADMSRRQATPARAASDWTVFARVVAPDGEHGIGTGLEPSAEDAEPSQRRAVHIDGQPARSQVALADHAQIVWLTPDMDRLFVEGASGRRRFLDRMVYGFAPDHAANLSAYERSMRERNRLLAEGGRDERWLSALEHAMAASGVAVAAARRQVVARLALAAEAGLGAFPAPHAAIVGDVESDLDRAPALAAEDALRRRLAESRRADAETGRTTIGPHRSDLVVHHRAKAMPAALCSTGEQKALLIGLVLAAARLLRLQRGTAPILLLDEIAAHLDPARRADLFDEIVALDAQAWMTGTDAGLFDALAGRAQFLAVGGGAARPATPIRAGT
jgi:DNA replication and repair protein RecF